MIKEIYGGFKFAKRLDYVVDFIKVLYMVYTLPFLVIGAAYYYVTLSNFDESMELSKISTLGRALVHILANLISIIVYAYLYWIFNGELELPR